MLDNEQKEYLVAKIKRDFLLGKITGTPSIPSNIQLEQKIAEVLAEGSEGIIGTRRDLPFKGVSDPDDYNKNIKDTKSNIEVLMKRSSDQINDIIDQINDSTIEKNRASRELRKISSSFKEVENGQLRDNGLSYAIIDTINDAEKIDLERTTASLNFNDGTAKLDATTADRLQFTHYRDQETIPFTITTGNNLIRSEKQVPGTTWKSVFTNDSTDRWEYLVETTDPGEVGGYITITLTENGNPVEINHVSLTLSSNYISDPDDPNGYIKLTFLDNSDGTNTWKDVPNGLREVSSPEVAFDFRIPAVTHIRINFFKNWPDDLVSRQYIFGLTEIVAKYTETKYESVMVSKSLEVTPYRNETPSIHSVVLTTQSTKLPGTNIRYYVAEDTPIPGKVVNSDGDLVDIDADDAYDFVANGTDTAGNAENYYAYASQLRDRPWLSGAAFYTDWEPRWQEIGPFNDNTYKVPSTVYFNNSPVRKDVHDMSFTDPYVWGDPRYTGPWPVVGSDWADDWDGTPGGAPKSGFIWGEDPFTLAGIWWGDGLEYPGWWRPEVPDVSGVVTWDPASPDEPKKRSYPDFSVPVFDTNDGSILSAKTFWKVFKWPSVYAPVPGSVKLYMELAQEVNETEQVNAQMWKWNYKDGQRKDTMTHNFVPSGQYYTIKMEDILDGRDFNIIEGTIENLRILNFDPGVISDDAYFIERDIDYTEQANGSIARTVSTAPSGAHVTLAFPGALSSYTTLTGDTTPDMSVDFEYTRTVDLESSWETYLYVRYGSPEDESYVNLADPSGAINKVMVIDLDDSGVPLEQREIVDVSERILLSPGWTKLRVFTDVDYTQDFDGVPTGDNAKWSPHGKINDNDLEVDKFVQSNNVLVYSSQLSMKQVDIYTLMYETDTDDDSRFAIVEEADGTQYLVVKTPSQLNFPSGVINRTHYTRRRYDRQTGGYLTYTTGTSGGITSPNAIPYSGGPNDPTTIIDESNIVDDLSDRPPNTYSGIFYPNVTTFGAEIQIEDPTASGFLFWDTAENLETFYRIQYNLPVNGRPSERMFFMSRFISDDPKSTPSLQEYELIINSQEDIPL